MRLGSFMKVTTSPKVSFPQLQLCHWGCLTGNLKPYQGQGQQGSSLVISSYGCYRDYFPRLLALPVLHCIMVSISALHALLDCYPLRAPGMLTPTFDQPCQSSPPHHSAPVALICSPHSCHVHRTACSRAQQSKISLFKTFCATCRRCDHLTQGVLWLLLILGVIALLCFSSHATLGHAQPIFPALHFAHRILGGSLNAGFTPCAHSI